jgi:hypothetical protein
VKDKKQKRWKTKSRRGGRQKAELERDEKRRIDEKYGKWGTESRKNG